MAPKLDEKDIFIERLRQEHLGLLSDFDCSSESENDFLLNDALANQQGHLSETYLLIEKSTKKAISYLTLTFGSFKLAGDRKLSGIKVKKKPFRIFANNMPCLLVAKLATDKREVGRGAATHLLKFAIQKAKEIDGIMALRFLALDAYVGKADFYQKKGFKIAYKPRKTDKTVTLYLELFI